MRYTKPSVMRMEEAISSIQSVNSTASSKPIDAYTDAHNPPVACTQFAYEADE